MASKEAEEIAAKWQNGKWYTKRINGNKIRFRLKNFSADVVDRFNEAVAREIMKAAAS